MAPNGRIWVVDSNQPRKSEFFRLAKIMLGVLIPKKQTKSGLNDVLCMAVQVINLHYFLRVWDQNRFNCG